MTRPMLLDVDTGVDDAMAIALATRLTNHQLVALTTVAGNVPVEYATRNTLSLVSYLGIDVPVYRGMCEPLVRPLHTAREHHGFDGLGGWEVPAEPAELQTTTAPEAIVQLAREHRGEITFVFVGPLTNLAVALSLEPRIADWVHRLVIMGGAFFKPGNVTSHAEFNIFVDPEAAARVAASGMNTTWVGLDVTHHATFELSHWQRISESDDPRTTLVREVTRRTLVELGREVSHLHDPLAVAVAEHPEVVSTTPGEVMIDVGEDFRGRTRQAGAMSNGGTQIASLVATTVDQRHFSRIFRVLADRSPA